LDPWAKKARRASLEKLDHLVPKEIVGQQATRVGRASLGCMGYQGNLVYLAAEGSLEARDPRDRERNFR
jgi:hypothetical protein